MKARFSLKSLILAALLGAMVVGAFAQAEEVEWYVGTPSSTTKRVAGTSNPLPAGIYPAWGADVSVTCNAGSSTASSQLAVGRYVVSCGAVAFGDQGTSAVAATMTERRIPSGYVYPVRVDNTTTDGYVALICTASTTCIISSDG